MLLKNNLHFHLDYNQAFRNWLEFRIGDMDDPRTTDHLDVVGFDAFGLVSLDGYLIGSRIAGIHKIRVEGATFTPSAREFTVDVLIPELNFDADHFNLRGRFGNLIPIFGQGKCAGQVMGKLLEFCSS